jgi:hypothetical protein
MGISRCRTIVRANSGLAFPVKTIKSFVATLPTIGFSRCIKYGWAGWIAKYILYFALRAVLRTSKIAMSTDGQVPRSTRMCGSGLQAILSNRCSHPAGPYALYYLSLIRLILAGPAGFEPTNARIKTWCLTTWRRPNKSQKISSHPAILVAGVPGYDL